jgi:hypothetical protein
MFELIVFGVILLAIGYWTTLFVMGRREDVLHGQFVEAEPNAEYRADPAPPARRRADREALQSLFAAIKRDLKDVARG